MNRHERRAQAARNGFPWFVAQKARKLEVAALRLTPERARKILAVWAAKTGRTVEEVEKLNGSDKGDL